MVVLRWTGKWEVRREWKDKETGEILQDRVPVQEPPVGVPAGSLEKEDIDRYARQERLSYGEAKEALLATGLWRVQEHKAKPKTEKAETKTAEPETPPDEPESASGETFEAPPFGFTTEG